MYASTMFSHPIKAVPVEDADMRVIDNDDAMVWGMRIPFKEHLRVWL
jgi:hypothetical protein